MRSTVPHTAFQREIITRQPAAASLIALYDTLPGVAFYAKDTRSRFVRANALALNTLGRRIEAEVLGLTDHDFHPPALAAAYIAEDQRVMATRRGITGQVWLVYHQQRQPVWYVSSKVPLMNERGKVIGLAGAMYPIEQPEEADRHFRELTPVIRHIETHYAEPVSMAGMARLAGISATHFNRRFQQLLRTSPTSYLLTVRVQAARRALSETRRTMAEIAADIGFCDQSHFTRHFRRHTGLTPAAYRKRYQSQG